MIFLSKLFRRLNTANIPSAKAVKHIAHSEPIQDLYRDRHTHFVADKLEAVVREMIGSHTSKALQSGKLFHIVDGNPDLKMSAIGEGNEVSVIVPYFESKTPWRLSVKELVPYENGLEGLVKGLAYNRAAINFYDNFFFANQNSYSHDQTISASVSALAYRLERFQKPDNYAENFCMYMPIPAEENGSADEIRLITRVQSLKEFELYGVSFLAITVDLAHIEENSLTTTLFVPKDFAPADLNVGEYISGTAWLFGQLA